MSKIPYIVIDRLNSEVTVDYESCAEDDLHETLLKELYTCMVYHGFFKCDENDSLECDDCGCRVMLSEYLSKVNGKKLCGACVDTTGATIEGEMFAEFVQFLRDNCSICEILYFVGDEWIRFDV